MKTPLINIAREVLVWGRTISPSWTLEDIENKRKEEVDELNTAMVEYLDSCGLQSSPETIHRVSVTQGKFREQVLDEIADNFLILARLADELGSDLETAVSNKWEVIKDRLYVQGEKAERQQEKLDTFYEVQIPKGLLVTINREVVSVITDSVPWVDIAVFKEEGDLERNIEGAKQFLRNYRQLEPNNGSNDDRTIIEDAMFDKVLVYSGDPVRFYLAKSGGQWHFTSNPRFAEQFRPSMVAGFLKDMVIVTSGGVAPATDYNLQTVDAKEVIGK